MSLAPPTLSGEGKSHVYGNDVHGVLTRDSAPLLFRLLVGDEPQIRRALDPTAGLPARQIYVRVQHLRGYDNQYEAGRSLTLDADGMKLELFARAPVAWFADR